jgi:hypothetical protein
LGAGGGVDDGAVSEYGSRRGLRQHHATLDALFGIEEPA